MARPFKNNLIDLIGEIDWISISPRRIPKNPDAITCSFFQTPNDLKTNRSRVKISLGKNVIAAMGWEGGDMIGVYHAPDNIFNIRLIKMPSNVKSHKLSKEAAGDNCSIKFIWPHEKIALPLKTKAFAVEFINHRNSYLVLNINPRTYEDNAPDNYKEI